MTSNWNPMRSKNVLITWALALACSTAGFGQIGDFGGPSILSRGGARPGQRGNTPMDFVVFAGAQGTVTTDPTGTGTKNVAYGEAAMFGLTGSHSRAKDFIGVDYMGSYHVYNNFHEGDGFEQSVAAQYDRRLARRWTMNLRESASISKLALGGVASYGFFTNDLIGVPVNNLFDAYAYSTQTSGGVTWSPSGRYSVSMFGDVFQVHRTAEFLIGSRGYRAGLSASRALSRLNEVSIAYAFMHFSFPRAFGVSDAHGVQIGWNHRFNRSWRSTLSGGAYRVETLGTQSVALSPEVAAILGKSTGIRAVYRVDYAPAVQAGLYYAYHRSNFSLTGTSGVSPGNGVYLTSKTNTANLAYGYSGFRKASLSANFGYVEYSSIYQDIGKYSSWLGGVGTGYRLTDYMSVTLSADVRQFRIQTGGNAVSMTAAVGIAFAPYRVPIPSF